MTDIRMQLDEKTQVIYQWIEGGANEDDAARIFAMTVDLQKRLLDPDKIRLLVISERPAKPTPGARRFLLEKMRKNELYKMAILGKNSYMKTLMSFFFLVSGMKKFRAFASESDALRWLIE